MNSVRKYFLLFLFLIHYNYLKAWIYPEHRDIAVLAIQKLSPENKSRLDKLWSDARIGFDNRLSEFVIDTVSNKKTTKLDFASWPAIAGDHSCSPDELLKNILESDWIMNVADVANHLKSDLEHSTRKSHRINALRDSDIKLQRADIEYATRAGSNNAHFLLSRPEIDISAINYFDSCLSKNAELNALAVYARFHTSALHKANQYSKKNLSDKDRSSMILNALADEAFALHFLEDAFAAGHVAGTWGNTAVRKGTHDYYNENGLDVTSWIGRRMVLMGDAYMNKENTIVTSESIVKSLEHFISAAFGQYIVNENGNQYPNSPDTFNVCINNYVPAGEIIPDSLFQILAETPVPGLSTGSGELSRFRSEIGSFVGVSTSLNAYSINGGFGSDQLKAGAIGSIEANVRFGFGMDGILNEAGDGLIFLQFGFQKDGHSTNQVVDEGIEIPAGEITSAIPGRAAYNLRFRLPFCLIPGDLLFAGPIILLISPKTFTKMAIASANGGLIPWQSGIHTPIGRFQFILGREIGISFFGKMNQNDVMLLPVSEEIAFVEYSSTRIEFPFLEYRPFRTFTQNQSSGFIIQFLAGLDTPYSQKVIFPENISAPELKSVWSFGIRFTFNWRHYL
jgi:hypothetical protein